VLVLNASYEPLNVCSTRRAHVLVWKGKAEVVERLEEPLRTATNTYVRPHVIRLVTYVRVPQSVKRRISRRALFARDGWRCAYCGDSSARLTLDHGRTPIALSPEEQQAVERAMAPVVENA